MRFKQCSKSFGLFLDLAPLIDMLFLLLIFLMIGSRFLRPVLDLKLPEAKSPAQADKSGIVLSIDRNANILLDGIPASLENLAQRTQSLFLGKTINGKTGIGKTRNGKTEIEKLGKKYRRGIIIQADRDTPFYLFVKIMEQIRKGGAEKIQIESIQP